MKQVIPFLALLLTGGVLHAQDTFTLPEAKMTAGQSKSYYVGAGFTQKILHVNTEWVNPYGIAYAKVGAFLNDDYPLGTQVGFRYPAYLNGKNLNGYYLGAYGGHIDSRVVDGKDKGRWGGGVDLAYVRLSSERLSILSIGIGAGEKLQTADGHTIAEVEPRLQFSYTLSVGL
jgi:hypothetical protein